MPRDVSLSDSKCWNGGHEWGELTSFYSTPGFNLQFLQQTGMQPLRMLGASSGGPSSGTSQQYGSEVYLINSNRAFDWYILLVHLISAFIMCN